MKRKFLSFVALALLLCMLVGAVGCNTANADAKPTEAPTEQPTSSPTDAPSTDAPSTDVPSEKPTEESTEAPTEEPTEKPTESPTENPTEKPTEKPTDEPEEPVELEEMYYYFPENAYLFKTYGRMQETADGLYCDPSASGLEFSGIMKGEVILELEVDRNTYFTVFVDGERIDERFLVEPTDTALTLVDFGEEEAEHTVRVLKQTEPKRSLVTLKAVTLTGYLEEAPEDKLFYIEFIGDSITSGTGIFGNSSTTSNVDKTYEYQDATSNYAFRTAEALNADFSLVSCSSIGICSGWNSYIEKEYYPAASFFRDREAQCDFERIPDLVVINLGTNDYTKGCSEKLFKERAEELIYAVRDSYSPSVDIVWVYNMMNDGHQSWVLELLEELGGESNGLYAIKMDKNNAGGTNHPNLDAHIAVAEKLTAFIEEKDLLF